MVYQVKGKSSDFRFQLKIIWLENSLALSINQIINLTSIPLTSYKICFQETILGNNLKST